jgi:hypothetical protein
MPICHSMKCNLRQKYLIKDFTIYYLYKMLSNALLIWQDFIIAKSGCYKTHDSSNI